MACPLGLFLARYIYLIHVGNTAVAFLVFDGFYCELAQLGFPLPMVASLKLKTFTLESVMWIMRCSVTGFSVSQFWPSGGVKVINMKNLIKGLPGDTGKPPRLRPAKE